jgi:phage terminase large subunit-like protein
VPHPKPARPAARLQYRAVRHAPRPRIEQPTWLEFHPILRWREMDSNLRLADLGCGFEAVRYWDLAATEKTEFNDPDWKVGVKLGRDRNGGY